MKSIFLLALLVFAFLPFSLAEECIAPYDAMMLQKSSVFCNDVFDVPSGITLIEDNIIIDCNGAIIRGDYMREQGFLIENRKNITIRNCNVVTFRIGISLKNTTHSVIEKNSLLKNDIGILMFDAYENIIKNNADKSLKTPVSAITSKFNTVILTNKNLEKTFCEVNSCNELKEINPCVNDDFYCSERCTYESDNDCPGKEAEEAKPELQTKSYEDIEKEVLGEIKGADNISETNKDEKLNITKKNIPWWSEALVYVFVYFKGFLIVQYHRYKKRVY